DKVIVEHCLKDHRAHDYVFDKANLFGFIAAEHRLIDPTFDDPEEHLEISKAIPGYLPKTSIGHVTYKRLLPRRELAAHPDKIKAAARVRIEGTCSEETLEDCSKVCGCPSLFRRFVAYWRAERDAGRLPTAGT